MHLKLIILFTILKITATLQNEHSQLPKFTNITEALVNLDQFVNEFISNNSLPSVVMGISVKGRTILQKAYGFADLENNVPASVQTHYRQASITKTFTSALFGSLVDQGLANYDDPVSKYLDEITFPPKVWKNKPVNITLRQLLSHTAGTYATIDEEEFKNVRAVQNVTENIAKFKNKPLLFKPSSSYKYSNYGYQLVGAVIESITKKSFQVVMKEFLVKHGLNSTIIETGQFLINNTARYYYFKDKNIHANIPTIVYDQLILTEGNWASGGLVSTLDDILRWGNLMIDTFKGNDNAILKQSTMKEIWTSQTAHLNQSHDNDYCLGWHKVHLSEKEHFQMRLRNYFGHNGGLYGVFTGLMIYPENEIVAVTFINKGEMPVNPEVIMWQMVQNLAHF